jgi:hypothetical protein
MPSFHGAVVSKPLTAAYNGTVISNNKEGSSAGTNGGGFPAWLSEAGLPMNNHFQAKATTKERAFLRRFGKEGYTFYTVKAIFKMHQINNSSPWVEPVPTPPWKPQTLL